MEGRAVDAKIAAHQCDVAFSAVHPAFVGNHAKFAVAGLDAAFTGARDGALVAKPVADQLGDSHIPIHARGRKG